MKTKRHWGLAAWIMIMALGAGGWAWREHERMLEAERAREALRRENAEWNAKRQEREFQLARAECAAEELRAALKALTPEAKREEMKDATALANGPEGKGKNGSWVHAIRGDPEVQALEVAAARGRLEAEFGRFCKKLGLTPAQQEKFYENLMTREAKVADVRAAGEAKDLADTDEVVMRLTREAFAACDTAQHELLGEAGYSQMKDYLAAMPARELASGLAVVATAAGVPLSADQLERLVPALRENGMRLAGPDTFPRNSDWTRIDTAARAVLTDAQFELLQKTELRGGSYPTRFMDPLDKAIERGREADAAAVTGARPGG